MRTFPEIMIFLPIGIFAHYTIKHVSNYIALRKKGEKIQATIIFFRPPIGRSFYVTKMSYELLDKKYESFVQYTHLTFPLPRRIGSKHQIFVSKEDPKNCILVSIWPLFIEIFLLGLMIYGGVYVMMH
jgi:hypothetical protein